MWVFRKAAIMVGMVLNSEEPKDDILAGLLFKLPR
jgi:hypothetical protein